MSAVAAIVGYSLRESLRRRVFTVVLILTVGFLALYALGVAFAFSEGRDFVGFRPRVVDVDAFVGSTVLGLAMFAILFLGAVLAVFLTLGVVRGDADRGLLQPIVVRPIGRGSMLVGRFLGAALVAACYVLVVYLAALSITAAAGGWTPDNALMAGLALAFGVTIVAAVSTLASVLLSSTAQGIAVLMLFGAGLTAGLLGQIGDAVGSRTLQSIADAATWVLPFEALYQGALFALVSETPGLTGVVLRLGPFGGADAIDLPFVLWAVLYSLACLATAMAAFARRDL